MRAEGGGSLGSVDGGGGGVLEEKRFSWEC